MKARTILLVEDNSSTREIAVVFLESAGYRVLEAQTAEEGIWTARETRPDLILMDLALPGMDGLEAVRVLRREPTTAATPILAFTAHAMKEDVEKALQTGCNGCITKPFRRTELLEAAARWTGSAGQERES